MVDYRLTKTQNSLGYTLFDHLDFTLYVMSFGEWWDPRGEGWYKIIRIIIAVDCK